MGCVSATNFICKRLKNFSPLRKTYYTKNGEIYQHVIATNGIIEIDFCPESNIQ